MQSSVHDKDFLLERETKAHSCPARAVPACCSGAGVLGRTPEGLVATPQKRWSTASTGGPTVPEYSGLQGAARAGEGWGVSFGRALQSHSSPGEASGSDTCKGCANT